MYRFKSGAVYATLLSAVWLTGCVTAPPKSETIELQRSAMQRWNACLVRHVDAENRPDRQISKIMGKDCEGYKRDVLALFPRHMAGQIDQMLVSSAYRIIDSIDDENQAPALTGELVKTVLR